MKREEFSDDEKKYPWLKILLDTYEVSDKMVAEHLKSFSCVACANNCSTCCEKPSVPITEPELSGISLFASEKLLEPLRSRVKKRLQEHEATLECPFLVDKSCSIYFARPLICRQFYVQNKPCAKDEDILSSRPQDIISPVKKIAKASSMRLLEYWGAKTKPKKERMFEQGFIPENSRQMHGYDWKIIARTMDAFDNEI